MFGILQIIFILEKKSGKMRKIPFFPKLIQKLIFCIFPFFYWH